MAVFFRRERPEAGTGTAARGGAGSTPAPDEVGAIDEVTIEQIVRTRMVRTDYQPIVRLDDGDVVAYEAFARGPVGSRFTTPREMFDAAGFGPLGTELDHIAQAAAYRSAMSSRMHPAMSLFVFANPADLGTDIPTDLTGVIALALSRLRIFMKIDDRSLLSSPARALEAIYKAREAGWGVAWDRIGETPGSAALIPIVRPDVVKLPVSLIRAGPGSRAGPGVGAVRAYAEESGASIAVTGIESADDAATAIAAGACLGQGYHFGRPGPIPAGTTAPHRPIAMIGNAEPVTTQTTPLRIATEQRLATPAAAETIAWIADDLEQRCCIDPEPPVVIACLPGPQLLSGAPVALLRLLARTASHVLVLAPSLPEHPVPGVRYAKLPPGDPLLREASFTVVGPHFAAMLAVSPGEVHTDAGDGLRYALTYHRPAVLRGARSLLARISPAPQRPDPAG